MQMQNVYVVDPYNMGSNVPMQPVIVQPQSQIQGVAMPVVASPIGPQFAGIQYVYVQDPLAELENCKGAIIRQQPEIAELLTGCEMANRYHVFGDTPQGLKYLFKCNERSGWCERNCCPSNIREFNMDIMHVANDGMQNMTKKFANAFKPLKCPCFCCNRPEIFVNVGDESIPIGKVKHLFTMCDPEFEVFEANGNLKYFVHADCCQCGLLCANNFCGKLSPANFNIISAGSNNIVASISKMAAQSYSEMITDADSYRVTFPQGASAYDKLLLIALALLIDYQYFETDGGNTNHNRGGYRYGYRYGYGF